MDGPQLDALQGKHYVLPVLDNDVVRVQAAGKCIRVGIKNREGIEAKWFDLAHPFLPAPPNLALQEGWKCTFDIANDRDMRITFQKSERKHVLGLRITDPSVSPKPVEVSWE
jgi:hypothetical protein